MDNKPDPAPKAVGKTPEAPRTASQYFPGIAERDIALIERVSTDLAILGRALRKGDKKAAQDVYPRLMKLALEGERIRAVARRAFAGGK